MQTEITPTEHIYGELQRAYNHFNNSLFEGTLPPCLFTLQREKRTYGYFSAKRFIHRDGQQTTGEIALNPSYFAVVPLLEVMQTIVHEMVHLWQYSFGDPGRRSYHNQEWADKMEAIGLMPSDTGKPGGRKTGEKMADYAIEGGLFQKSCEELVRQGFTLNWLDRFPPVEAILANTKTIRVMSIPQGPLGDALQEAAIEVEPEKPKLTDKSNRLKQRCPKCEAQAWGKPSLRLICGEPSCEGQPFEAVIDKPAEN